MFQIVADFDVLEHPLARQDHQFRNPSRNGQGVQTTSIDDFIDSRYRRSNNRDIPYSQLLLTLGFGYPPRTIATTAGRCPFRSGTPILFLPCAPIWPLHCKGNLHFQQIVAQPPVCLHVDATDRTSITNFV